MNTWGYQITDTATGRVLKKDTGFETEADAVEQAEMEMNADNIKGACVSTFQAWEDI